jgi:hypothetical protein
LAGGTCRGTRWHNGPGRPLEQTQQLLGNEARPRSIEVTITLRVLAVHKEALWHNKVKVILCAGHSDVE